MIKKVICFTVVTLMLLHTTVFASTTYYDVSIEGLTYSEKEELTEWLEYENIDYDVESYTSNSNTSNTNTKELEVEELTTSQKNTLVTWLQNRDYDYSTRTKNGYYYVTIEYTSSTKNTLINYLDSKDYYYGSSNTSNTNTKELEVEELTTSQKNTLVNWLKNRDYEYTAKSKNGYYYVTIEYTSSTKNTLINYLDSKDYYYGSSNTSNTNTKELEVEELTTSQKNTLVNWLKNREYEYSTKSKNGYYYVTIEYTSSTKNTLINYLDSKDYYYDSLNSFSQRTGNAYLVANGAIWYAEGEEIEKVDDIYSAEYVLFTKEGGIAYINDEKRGMYIADMSDPTESEQIVKSARSINQNSSGYAISFKSSINSATKIESIYDNEDITVYIVKNNTLYSLSEKNKLSKIKLLQSTSSYNTYSKNNTNIGFSEWGDLVFIDSSGVCFYNEEIDDVDAIELLKDQNDRAVQVKYLTVNNGVVKNLTLLNGATVKIENDD